MISFLLATRNPKKAKELLRLLRSGARHPPQKGAWHLLTLDQFQGIPPVLEDGSTFKANAVKKAVETSRHTILPVLAEDSGLEVRALGGKPGVHSARFAQGRGSGRAGLKQNDKANIRKLLRCMSQVPASKRQGRFVCCLAMAIHERLVRTFRAACTGRIALHPAGRTGFGYDPVFIPRGHAKTMAQLGPQTKDGLSHRGKAIRKLRVYLKQIL